MDFIKDLVVGVRSLRKDYSFGLVAVLTLAIAIGANSAIFSLVSAILLRPLPYQSSRPHRAPLGGSRRFHRQRLLAESAGLAPAEHNFRSPGGG